MTGAGWVTVTLLLATAGFATGVLLASLTHVTLEYGLGAGGAASAMALLFLATVPSLARLLRRAGDADAPGARSAPNRFKPHEEKHSA